MPNDEPPRDLFGDVIAAKPPKPPKSKPSKTQPTSQVPPPRAAVPPPPVERHVTYRMDWVPLGKLVLAAIVLFVGIVFGTQIEIWVHADHAPHPLYVSFFVGVVIFYVVRSAVEAIQAFASAPGHPPRLRHEVIYATSFRARFARVWRLIVALIVIVACLASTVYAWPDVRNVYQTISEYVRKSRPLEEPKKHPPPRPKVTDKSFLEDPLGWLQKNTKEPPSNSESWPPRGP